jgi:type II secretory pathway component GspD/PulD (secretin)
VAEEAAMLDRTPATLIAGCLLAILAISGALAETPAKGAPVEGSGEKAAETPKPFRHLRTFPAVELGPRPHRWRGEPISLSLRDADLVEVLRSFAKLAKVNLVIDPAVKGTVTVELHDVPWDQALYVILKAQDLGMEVSGNVWSLTDAERLYREKTSSRTP